MLVRAILLKNTYTSINKNYTLYMLRRTTCIC